MTNKGGIIKSHPSRNFSTPNTKSVSESAAAASKPEESIFASADYFKDVKKEEIVDPTQALDVASRVTDVKKFDELLWMDSNDSLGTTMAHMAKDLDNLVQGVQTYGFSEMLIYYETLLWDLWQFMAESQGLGMGVGLIAASFLSRSLFAPVIIYSQTMGMKMKLI